MANSNTINLEIQLEQVRKMIESAKAQEKPNQSTLNFLKRQEDDLAAKIAAAQKAKKR
jgi:hypothetical protein